MVLGIQTPRYRLSLVEKPPDVAHKVLGPLTPILIHQTLMVIVMVMVEGTAAVKMEMETAVATVDGLGKDTVRSRTI